MARPSESRPSKMGRKWTQDDVLAYKIKIVYEDLTTFFGVTDLPPPDVSNDALTAQDSATSNDFRTYQMLMQMEDVLDPSLEPVNRASETIDFVRELLRLLRYEDVTPKGSMVMRPKLTYMASQGKPPEVDICIRDDSKAIILVVKVDRHSHDFDPEPRLISDAIAAFHNDNIRRVKHLGTNPLTSKVMPGMVVDGTMPSFYKIPVTPELVAAVESGIPPEQETVIHAYLPEVPRPEEGMKPLDNRYILLSCLSAFKQFL